MHAVIDRPADRTAAAARSHAAAAALGPPALAVAVMWISFAVRAALHGEAVFRPHTWSRWDSGFYVMIARDGYTARWHCGTNSLPPHLPPGNYLCGTVQWFPGYSALIRGLSELTRLPLDASALLLSWLCWFVFLAVAWRLLADAVTTPARWVCLGLLAAAPGAIYFAAIFPMSFTLAGMTCCLYFAFRSPWRWAPLGALVAGVAAGSGYMSAIVLAPALLVGLLCVQRVRRPAVLAGATGVAAGFGAVLLTAQLSVGIWNGYFIAQSKYATGTHNPLAALVQYLQPLWTPGLPGVRHATAAQAAYTTVLVMAVLAGFLVIAADAAHRPRWGAWSRPGAGPGPRFRDNGLALDLTVAAAAAAAWVSAYSAGARISVWRPEAFVVVGVILLRRVPARYTAVLLLGAYPVAVWMSTYFFSGALV
ncbi:MAG TPA: hypothetical protein VI357_26295 [Mycobacteriales bacterium]